MRQNPALRHQLSFEMSQMQSETELHFDRRDGNGTDQGGDRHESQFHALPVLQEEQRVRTKMQLLSGARGRALATAAVAAFPAVAGPPASPRVPSLIGWFLRSLTRPNGQVLLFRSTGAKSQGTRMPAGGVREWCPR